ncbi:unnamed protein product [Prorocentrum cordatum]|uniref:Helicase C-terminal domain-containing protein n=1 Tax=Prorocentrum cordatum TaxID=2364126 RepID=A0ABN9RD78_9DINO|nr:unnamed protein product [Polarella glacialis]
MAGIRELAVEALRWPHLAPWQRLEWAAALRYDAVPVKELPPWWLAPRSLTRRDIGVDLVSLDGERAVQCKCCNGTVQTKDVTHFICTAQNVFRASEIILATSETSRLTSGAAMVVESVGVRHDVLPSTVIDELLSSTAAALPPPQRDCLAAAPLRPCQRDCIRACRAGARIIEMACGTGKTLVMRRLADTASGRVLVSVPSLALLWQHIATFPEFCPVGTRYNTKIAWDAPGYISVTDSVHLLGNIHFSDIFVDEAHHPLPPMFPKGDNTYWSADFFSATHKACPDHSYGMGQAIDDGVLCDYDLVVPVVDDEETTFAALAGLLLTKVGHFRRVLAYCNSIDEALLFKNEVAKLGLVAWHINGETPRAERQRVLKAFSRPLQGPAHVLVTVQVLGEGINIGSADTCLFVQPRRSYVSIVQAVGRVLRLHPSKPLAHVILPAVTPRHSGQEQPLGTQDAHGEAHGDPAETEAEALGNAPSVGTAVSKSTPSATSSIRRAASSRHPTLSSAPLPSPYLADERRYRAESGSAEKERKSLALQAEATSDVRDVLASRSQRAISQQKASSELERFVATLASADCRFRSELTLGCSSRISLFDTRICTDHQGNGIQDLEHRVRTSLQALSRSGCQWQSRLHQLCVFLKAHGRLPTQGTVADEEELRLANWLKRQAGLFRSQRLAEDREAALRGVHTLVCKRLSGERHQDWQSWLQQLEEFLEAHGRLPTKSKVVDEEEFRLAQWLERQARFFRSQRLAEDREAALKGVHTLVCERLSGERPQQDWHSWLQQLEEFLEAHGRLPTHGKVADEKELRIAQWLNAQLSLFGSQRLAEDREAALRGVHTLVCEKLSGERRQQDWQCWLQQLEGFLEAHGRLPTQCKVADEEEFRLARWLKRQAGFCRSQRLAEDREAALRGVHTLVCEKLSGRSSKYKLSRAWGRPR